LFHAASGNSEASIVCCLTADYRYHSHVRLVVDSSRRGGEWILFSHTHSHSHTHIRIHTHTHTHTHTHIHTLIHSHIHTRIHIHIHIHFTSLILMKKRVGSVCFNCNCGWYLYCKCRLSQRESTVEFSDSVEEYNTILLFVLSSDSVKRVSSFHFVQRYAVQYSWHEVREWLSGFFFPRNSIKWRNKHRIEY
jgi:hypothetical protein